MEADISVRFDHPANAGILTYLGSKNRLLNSSSVARQIPSCSPASVKKPYMKLGCHPDLVTRLWDEVTIKLPINCQWVVYGTPVLVHPSSGIIFAFGGGTHTYAFRLPPQQYQEAIQAGAKRIFQFPVLPNVNNRASALDLATIGKEWVFGYWLKGEEEWCLAAFDFAGETVEEI